MAQSSYNKTDYESQSFKEISANATVSFLTDPKKCPLCKQNFVNGRTTPCGHTFCGECLRDWMRFGLTCPACKTILSVGDLSRSGNNVTCGHDGGKMNEMDHKYKGNERKPKI